MSNRTVGETLTWAGTVVAGAWLSLWVARCVTECMGRVIGTSTAAGPVRELVEEVLEAHQADDTVMVQAFEEALADEAEETADVR
jgi:hypothetical protein